MASDKPTTRLRELRGSGFEIAKGQPDIRGWDVRDENGRKFGKVHELIFDKRARKVRYMVINIRDTKELELEKRTVLVPIGLALLDNTDDDVILQSVTPFQLRALPRYDKNNLGAKVEQDISVVFGRTHTAIGNTGDEVDAKFYEHDHFNEDNMYRKRLHTDKEKGVDKTTNSLSQKEAPRLPREAGVGKPVDFPESKDDKHIDRYTNETEEEYQRRLRSRKD